MAKKLFLAGVVSSDAKDDTDKGRYYQHRQLTSVLIKKELDKLQLKFSEENTFGNSRQVHTIYELKQSNPADKEIISKLDIAVQQKEKEQQMNETIQKYVTLLEQQKNIVLTGAPGT